MEKGWLKCDISEGQFPEEVTVKCSSYDGHSFSFFANSDFVDTSRNAVRVDVMECRGNSCLVYMPIEPLEGGVSRTVRVNVNSLVESKNKPVR
jgi:hypothetical protein